MCLPHIDTVSEWCYNICNDTVSEYEPTVCAFITPTNSEEERIMQNFPKIALTAEETAELEAVAESLGLHVIRFWEKEMK